MTLHSSSGICPRVPYEFTLALRLQSYVRGMWSRLTFPMRKRDSLMVSRVAMHEVRDHHSQWIILVARDQPDLFAHLARAFAGDDKVERAYRVDSEARKRS